MAYLGEEVKKLGFGLMRLPMKNMQIDIEQTKEMCDLFLKNGFTYFDTAYGYSEGKSEEAIKTALVDRHPRESFQLATKLPAWAGARNAEEAREMFNTSLKRTGAGYFDFYLLHNLGSTRTKSFDDFGMWDYIKELKDKGLVRHMGFSIHDKAEVLDKVLTEHPEMEFVQLQINYADWESDFVQSRKCYEVALRHKKPVIIMEPVKGGMLANPAPQLIDMFKAADKNASAASWAIRFAASLDNVITVLSGMSNLEQMQDNISYMKDFKPLTQQEQEVIKKAREELDKIPSVPCTACEYCVAGCPKNIAIPKVIEMLNRESVFGDLQAAKFGYNWETASGGKASHCIACGKCEDVCPQQIEIIKEMKNAAEKFE